MTAPNRPKIVLILVGPTAVGKTRMGTLIAEKLPVEIVSADSRQVFQYMDIGTAKPSKEILRLIPHHFIDILKPDEHYSAGIFGSQARKVIDEIFSRKKVPLVVGGSGLYIKSLLSGFFGEDVRDEKIRESLHKRLETEGSDSLHRDLAKVDPEAAQKIHPQNSQRLVRALEVYLASGMKISDLQKRSLPPPSFAVLKFGLIKNRLKLYQDINDRVERMFQDGLLAEVAHILDKGYESNLNSLNTVGYKETIEYLNGKLDFDECVEQIKRNSRHYAKRQLTWFNADPEIQWLEVETQEDFETAAGEIVTSYLRAAGNKSSN